VRFLQRFSKSTLWLLAATGASLALGLVLSNQGFFIAGSAVGLAIAVQLVWAAVRAGGLGSDLLALVSIVATSLTQEWLAGAIIALMLATGRALESWAAGQARSQLEALVQRSPRSIQLLQPDGSVLEVEISKVKIGDRFLVRAGEVVAVDATLEADASFDESALTGEPLPKNRLAGDEVPSGVVNAGSSVAMVATTTAEASTYAGLVRLVQQAKASSAPGVRIANRWAIWFVPLSLALAAGAWLTTGDVEPAIAVLVAATPCPLILAIPIAIISGISRGASHGAIIKDGAALESLARSEVLLVDKTGTLTLGGPELTNVQAGPGVSESEVLRIAATIEQSSAHVLAKAVVRGAQARGVSLGVAGEVSEVLGEGLFAEFEGHRVRIGRLSEPAPDWVNLNNSLQICVDVDDQVIGVIDLDDPIRHDAAETINRLRGFGIRRVLLVTGDRRAAGEQVGLAVGVDEVYAECRPEQKLEIVRSELAKSAGSVLVVGDGINDSPALAAADVGVAMGARGATAASETADVVIIEDSIGRLADAIEISKGARNRALQAAGLGMGLSVLAMFSGALGLTTITQNALLQELIDALAILLALVPTKLSR
jgi:heavy metal translocating P-type ATPase